VTVAPSSSSVLTFEPTNHVYTVDGQIVPSVTQLLDEAGLTVDYTAVPYRVREHARQRGLHVDLACDLYDEGDLDWSSVHPECVGFVESWIRFREDERYEPVASQVPLYHPELQYCGTLDSVGTLNGSWVVVERKATARMSPLYALQLAGYSQAPYAAPTGGGPLRPVPWGTPARLGVQLKRDGSYAVVPFSDSEDLAAFLGVVALSRWRGLRRDAMRRNGRVG
jgi:hypothetical protein